MAATNHLSPGRRKSSIGADSPRGSGAVEASSASVSLPPNLVSPSDTSILVVDDETTTLRVVGRMLQACGYKKVKTASSGKQALDLLKKEKDFDLVLSDVHMPVMDGIALVQEIKKLRDDMTILMMSGTEDMDIVYRCLSAGADHYILKPVKKEDLRTLWQRVFRKRQEVKVLNELEHEKNTNKELQEKTAKLENAYSKLQVEVKDGIESSVRIISKEVEGYLTKADVPPNVLLGTILKQLRSINIYQDAFTKLLSDTSDTDPMTKQWICDVVGLNPNEAIRRDFDSSSTFEEINPQTAAVLQSWDFDVWAYQEFELLPMIEEMFNNFGLLKRFNVPQDKFRSFLVEVSRNYIKKNPYHNFRHAFDVTQTVYLFLTSAAAGSNLNPLEIFALLVACLIHDLGHPGLNNNYQILTWSSLALKYNDRSVLENHHVSLAWTILMKPENNIFVGLTEDMRREVRNIIITCVLATDLANHRRILESWNEAASNFTKDKQDHRLLLLQMLIKAADISNPGKPFQSAKYWALMVQEEFFTQGDQERKKKLPISAFMDRNNPNLPQMQIGFLDFLVVPLFKSMEKVLPELMHFNKKLEENRLKWQHLNQVSANATSTT